MRERILEVLKLTRNNALTIEEIYNKVYHTEIVENQIDVIKQEIVDLQEEKLVYCTNSTKGLYTLNPFKEGIFHIKRNGDFYVSSNGETIDINNEKSFGCLEGDKVLVRITDFNSMEGTIKEIIERHGLVAEVITMNNKRFAVIGEERYQIELDSSIVDGMLIGIKIDKTKSGNYYKATLDKVIGHKNAPKLDEKKILYEYGINDEFSNETMEELKSIPTEVKEEDLKNRKDLRDKMIFTIDGDDTKDIDDAISLDNLENGNFLLGVHIADVSHYVKANTALDIDARERGTSVYMPGVVSPMYPPQLSNGICSLNPNVDRLAISCEMEFDHQGKLINFDIFKSVIHSNIQMTYKKVNQILEEDIIPEGYENYYEKIKEMNNLAKILHKMRERRGSLDFDAPEVKINVDDKGKVLDITLRNIGIGEGLIEDFMLVANETVATYIFNMGLNSIYRVHDFPNEERLSNTINVIKSYGEKIESKVNSRDPKVLQKILGEIKGKENFDIYSNMILRSMAKAVYKNLNEGHFGIGIDSLKGEAYTHFTSPIRRYPDTTVHRVLTSILNGDIETIQTDDYKKNIIDIATHSSEMEQIADRCEKEADKMKMADYMSNFIGNEFKGKIVGFTKHGMFVQLENYVEGRVGFNTMDDYYVYNEELEVLVGERKKKIYRLGDKIFVKVIKSEKETREIDFEIINKKNGDKNGDIK